VGSHGGEHHGTGGGNGDSSPGGQYAKAGWPFWKTSWTNKCLHVGNNGSGALLRIIIIIIRRRRRRRRRRGGGTPRPSPRQSGVGRTANWRIR